MAVDRTRRVELPGSAWAVLGLLSFGEQSGYDLQKFVEKSVAHFFDPAKSQIYAQLRRLVEVGYATERHVAQDDRPDKRMYAVTPAGEEALRSWLAEPPGESTFRSPLLFHVFMGHLMDPATLADQVRAYRDECSALVRELEGTGREIESSGYARFPHMTLRAGLINARASLRWCDEVIRGLAEEEGAR